jgi:NAD(P)H dehydrogenase (quinone)
MTIAITGATGQLGRLAVEALKARVPADQIVALVRDPAKAADLGVATRVFDYDKAETLVAALKGVDTLVLISSNAVGASRLAQHQAVIDAAVAAGVGRVLYTSIPRADTSPMLLATDHRNTEAAVRASGLPFTFLRNGWYTENHTASLGASVAAGALIGSAGDGRFSTAPRQDYAEAIAAAATQPGHAGKIYELGGDESYSFAELAAEVSRLVGKSLPYNDLPPEAYARILTGFGIPEGFAGVLADCDVQARDGALEVTSGDLARLIGRPTTPWQKVVAAALA